MVPIISNFQWPPTILVTDCFFRMWVLFKGGSYMRKYGRQHKFCNEHGWPILDFAQIFYFEL